MHFKILFFLKHIFYVYMSGAQESDLRNISYLATNFLITCFSLA